MLKSLVAAADDIFLNTWPVLKGVVIKRFLGLPSRESWSAAFYAGVVNEDSAKIIRDFETLRHNARSSDPRDIQDAHLAFIRLRHEIENQKLVEALDSEVARPGNRGPHVERPSTVFDRGEVSVAEIGQLGLRVINKVAKSYLAKFRQEETAATAINGLLPSLGSLKSNFAAACGFAGLDPSKNDAIFGRIDHVVNNRQTATRHTAKKPQAGLLATKTAG